MKTFTGSVCIYRTKILKFTFNYIIKETYGRIKGRNEGSLF